MSNVRLAKIGDDGVVETVIEAPAGSTAEFASDVLGMPGIWAVDAFAEAGPGSLFVEETGEFYAIDLPEDPPADPEEPAP